MKKFMIVCLIYPMIAFSNTNASKEFMFYGQNESIPSIIHYVSSNYGFNAVTDNCLAGRSFSGSFKAKNLDEVIKYIETRLRVNYIKLSAEDYFFYCSQQNRAEVVENVTSPQYRYIRANTKNMTGNHTYFKLFGSSLTIFGPDVYINKIKSILDKYNNKVNRRSIKVASRIIEKIYYPKNITSDTEDALKKENSINSSSSGGTNASIANSEDKFEGLAILLNKLVAKNEAEDIVIADRIHNSVIIRGTPDYVNKVYNLAKKIDSEQDQVQINVTIIDIDQGAVNELGIDWSAKFNGNKIDSNIQSPNASFNLNAVISSGINKFTSKIKFLSDENKASIISHPILIGTSNRPAVLNNQTTRYVRLEGRKESNLQAVTYGMAMSIIPRPIIQNKQKKIALSISMQDGSIDPSPGSSGDLSIKHSLISTHAVINEGDSLLIGGFYLDKTSTIHNGVPGLKNIPLLGRLFDYSSKEKSRKVRLILIQPKIVTSSGVVLK